MDKKSEILVSVIMCVYNTPDDYLIEATKSILNQTYKRFELIIVDDASTADLYQDSIFNDNRIVLLKNENNKGPAYSRNKALEVAKGNYIAIMDSDDISLPNRLEKQIEYMERNPDVVACGTWFKYIGYKKGEAKRVIDDNEYYRCCLLFGNDPTILNPSTIIRKETLDKYSIRYDERMRYGEDYKMWYQLSKIGKVTNYKEVLLLYRIHSKQSTQQKDYLNKTYKRDNIVGLEILNELKLMLSEEEQDLFFNYLYARNYNVNKYINILHKVVEANKITHIYQQNKLEQRVHEQWISAVQHVKNPFKLLSLLHAQKGHRKEIIGIKSKQLWPWHK